MKYILSLLMFASSWAFASEQHPPLPLDQCSIHVPYGQPVTSMVQICRTGYLSFFDSSAKIPSFTAYTLTPEHAMGCVVRTNSFTTDSSISSSATPTDYSGTQYDRGHLSPDGDMSWNEQVEHESFYMTNMAPQAGSFNRGIWKLLETSVRGWVIQQNDDYTIYSGGVYDKNDKTIGNKVIVPHAFYKVVINNSTKEYAAWYFPHVSPYPNLGNDLVKYRATLEQVKKASRVNFPVPIGKELAFGTEWPVDYGKLTKLKQVKCPK